MRPCIIAGDPPVVSSPPFPPPSADGSSSSSSSSSLPIPSPARNSKHPRRRSSPEEEAPAPRPDQIRWPTATSPGESSRSRLRSDCLGVDLPTPLTRFPPFLFFFFIFPFCADFLFLLSVCSRLVWICAGDAATPQRARCGRFFFFFMYRGFWRWCCVFPWFGFVLFWWFWVGLFVQRRESARLRRRRTCATSTSWSLARHSPPMKVRHPMDTLFVVEGVTAPDGYVICCRGWSIRAFLGIPQNWVILYKPNY